ncbi:MAG TPA: hypothetical protein VFB76_11740 [Candidatus Angelobacter sp.]|nr:hypothetical protein [Candidatus Angelobacter sp.]
MSSVTVYVVQAGLSFLMLYLLAIWFIVPYLAKQPIRKAMLVLLSPHIAHHVGLAVLVPGVVGVGFPRNFATIIAIGEPTMLFLLILCMGALRSNSRRSSVLLWIFTVAGFAYNFISAYVALTLGAALVDKLDAHWYVSVFYVPLLAASHILILINLLKRGNELKLASA